MKAGGKNTNLHGKKFENHTNNENRLIEIGYKKIILDKKLKFGFYYEKDYVDKKIIFTLQQGIKCFLKHKHNIDFFGKFPDGIFVIEYKDKEKNIEFFVIEKKEQHQEGSVIEKILNGPIIRQFYQILLSDKLKAKIHFSYCINNWLKNKFNNDKTYKTFYNILKQHEIKFFFGEEENYFDELFKWIGIDEEEKEKTLEEEFEKIKLE